jgi:hypothetical protein
VLQPFNGGNASITFDACIEAKDNLADKRRKLGRFVRSLGYRHFNKGITIHVYGRSLCSELSLHRYFYLGFAASTHINTTRNVLNPQSPNFLAYFSDKKLVTMFKRLCQRKQPSKFAEIWKELDELTSKYMAEKKK